MPLRYWVRWEHNGKRHERRYYTPWHAEQMTRALTLNGLVVTTGEDRP